MADRIKGITVVLGGDTTGLNKALSGTNKEIKSTQAQLKDVERLLKLDPTNTKLLEQRQRLLSEAVGETRTKLTALKEAEKQVQEQFKKGEISQQQYDALQREIVETENQLKGLQTQAEKSNDALASIKTVSDKVALGASNLSKTMLPATAAIAGIGGVAFNAASDLVESQNKVDVAFGDSAESIKNFAETTLDAYGIAKGTAMDMAAQFGDMGTSMGLSSSATADMSKSLVGLVGDLASFKNISTDQAMTALNGIFTGETESLKTLGIVMTQTNLDAYALANGFGKTTKEMTEAEKVQLRYAYIMNATKNAQGDFSRTSDGAANSMRIMKESAKEATAEFGQALLPVITPLIQKVTELIKGFSALDDGQKKTIITVLALVAAIGPVAGIISGIASAASISTTVISTLRGAIAILTGTATTGTTAATALAKAIAFLTSPIGIVIAAIVAAVALIAVKGDEIQAILQKVDDFLQNVFATDWTKIFGPVLGNILNGFFKNVKNIWDSIKRIFSGVIDFIRGVFTGDWERAWKGVQDIFGGLFNGLVALAKAPLNGIIGLLNMAIGAINSLINGFNSIGFTMPKWLGGGSWHPNIPNIPSIPFLAKGGTVLSGSAIVGEAGPELLTVGPGGTRVQPITNSSTNDTYLGGLTLNVYGAPGQSENELANIIMEKIQSATLRKGAVFGA